MPWAQHAQHPDLVWCYRLEHLFDSNEVLERLGHFETRDVQVAHVEKVVGPAISIIVCLTLGNFIVMVREFEIDAARVYVVLGPVEALGHNTAFDVPTGPSPTPRRGPRRLSRQMSFPQGKVNFVFLLSTHAQFTFSLGKEFSIGSSFGHQFRVFVLGAIRCIFLGLRIQKWS